MGANFVGQSKVRCPASDHVCEACCYISSRLSAVPGRPAKEGKKLGGNFRNYSHLFDAARSPAYANASKGEKPIVLEFLRAEHRGEWFAAIAESGQKHVLPWTPMNPPCARGRVLFEEAVVTLPPPAGWLMVDDMVALLTAGATKDEIERGDYGPRAWSLARPQIDRFEHAWSGERGGGWFDLALWLSQRDEAAVEKRLAEEKEKKQSGKTQRRRTRGTAPTDGDADSRDPRTVPPDTGGERAQALGSAHGADSLGGANKRKRRRVADVDAPVAPDPEPEQLSLEMFGPARRDRGPQEVQPRMARHDRARIRAVDGPRTARSRAPKRR
jgi:hypothetical protein